MGQNLPILSCFSGQKSGRPETGRPLDGELLVND
jgi:hypothetical protein